MRRSAEPQEKQQRLEAERYVEWAKRYIQKKKYEKAEKLARKAHAFFPTKKTEDLVINILTLSGRNQQHESAEPSVIRCHDATQNRSHPETVSEYTKEQLKCVKAILKYNNYYKILGVSKQATNSDIKQSYKKLALKVHPDKNKAPGATEAFRKIVNAVDILTDPIKRIQYDTYCFQEERRQNVRTRQQHSYNYTRRFETNDTSEESFNMFDYNFPREEFYTPGGTRHQYTQEEYVDSELVNTYSMLFQMLLFPLIIFFFAKFILSTYNSIHKDHDTKRYTMEEYILD